MLRLLLFSSLRCHCLCLLAFFASPATASASASHPYSHLSSTSLSAPSTSASRPHLISHDLFLHHTFTHSSPIHPIYHIFSHRHHFCGASSNDDDHAIIYTYIYMHKDVYMFFFVHAIRSILGSSISSNIDIPTDHADRAGIAREERAVHAISSS